MWTEGTARDSAGPSFFDAAEASLRGGLPGSESFLDEAMGVFCELEGQACRMNGHEVLRSLG